MPSAARFISGEPALGMVGKTLVAIVVAIVEVGVSWVRDWKGEGLAEEEKGIDGKWGLVSVADVLAGGKVVEKEDWVN